jgi:hypothetical protein
VHPFLATDPFWGNPYEEQVKQATEAVIRLKPFIDFFVGSSSG